MKTFKSFVSESLSSRFSVFCDYLNGKRQHWDDHDDHAIAHADAWVASTTEKCKSFVIDNTTGRVTGKYEYGVPSYDPLHEGAKMHHGSANAPAKLDSKPPNRTNANLIDTIIGTHYAADPKISDKFKEGNYGRKAENPATFETRRPPRSQLVKVHGKGWDQTNISKHVVNTVFNRPDPENKHLFRVWAQETRRITPTEADRIYDSLSKGENPNHFPNESRDKKPSVGGFINFYDPHLNMGGLRHHVANKYRNIMQSQGKKGLVYINTSPNETKDVKSKKSYIIFDPSKLPHEKK